MRTSGYGLLALALCASGFVGCGHGQPGASAAPMLVAAAAPAASTSAASNPTAVWGAARWYALFEHVPAPPKTVAEAGTLAGPVTDTRGDTRVGPIGKALSQSRAQYHAGMAALQSSARDMANTRMAEMKASGVEALAEKMKGASQAEKMQLAMQMAAKMRHPTADRAGLMAAGNIATYLQTHRSTLYAIHKNMRESFKRIEAQFTPRHAALDADLLAIVKKCPPIAPHCGDTTDCPPKPECVAAVNRKIPGLIAQHRQVAQAELDAERAAYEHAQTSLQPIMAKLAELISAGEHAGASTVHLRMGYATFDTQITLLQVATARIVSRAGFWQGVQARPFPADFDVYVSTVPPYAYRLGESDVTSPPDSLPYRW